MQWLRGRAAILALLAAHSVQAQQSGPACPTAGQGSPDALSREWILVGWDRKANDGAFVFRDKLDRYYDWSTADAMIYDDADPQRRVVRRPAAMAAAEPK